MYVSWLEEFSTEELLALTFYNSFLSHSHSDASWIIYSHLLSLPCSLLLFCPFMELCSSLTSTFFTFCNIQKGNLIHLPDWNQHLEADDINKLLQLNGKHIFGYLIVIFLLSHNTVHSKLNFLSTLKLLLLSSFSVKQWYCHLSILPC